MAMPGKHFTIMEICLRKEFLKTSRKGAKTDNSARGPRKNYVCADAARAGKQKRKQKLLLELGLDHPHLRHLGIPVLGNGLERQPEFAVVTRL